jgi:transposase InsO family protein
MADRRPPCTPLVLSPEALFRYQIVSAVKARALSGQRPDAAVRAVAAQTHPTPAGEPRAVSVRSIYRWLAELEGDAPASVEPVPPAPVISRVLPAALLDFLRAEKAEDRYASVPELLRRAHQLGVIGPHQRVDRTSVWRACVRLGLPLRRVPAKQEADQRRFAYPHRMQMVLADGKHFRAGIRRRKRVALFFLDDASRFGLGVVVGTDETAALFLRGLHAVLRRFGFMDIVFLDRGPGFRADDTAAACHRLDIHLVLGTAEYPEGHGKIEKFNQTAQAQLLRGLVGAADVDDDCGALELRLAHFLDHAYNRQPHESLGGQTPLDRFEADTRALRFPEGDAELADRFVVTDTRKVSNDNVISYASTDYEVPRGHAGTDITVWRHLLSGALSVVHDGKLVTLAPVDLARNAVSRRAVPPAPAHDDDESAPRTAAQLAFARDFAPVVGPDGGFPAPPTRSSPTKGRSR